MVPTRPPLGPNIVQVDQVGPSRSVAAFLQILGFAATPICGWRRSPKSSQMVPTWHQLDSNIMQMGQLGSSKPPEEREWKRSERRLGCLAQCSQLGQRENSSTHSTPMKATTCCWQGACDRNVPEVFCHVLLACAVAWFPSCGTFPK